jgi:hypothetical protein
MHAFASVNSCQLFSSETCDSLVMTSSSPATVLYECNECSRETDIADDYYCHQCQRLKCDRCVSLQIETYYCSNCLDSVTPAEASQLRNEYGNFECLLFFF